MPDVQTVEAAASRMRKDIVEMIAEAGSGHPGGSLSAADIVATLYFGGVLKHDPANPDWPERDRFILSKGHAAPVLYSALAEAGYFGRDHLLTLRKLGSMLQGHPDSKKTPGVEVSTGSLGQGLSISGGLAAGLRGGDHPEPSADDRTVYCLMGDGEIQEGQVWEAAMFAAHEGLNNLIAIVDHNVGSYWQVVSSWLTTLRDNVQGWVFGFIFCLDNYLLPVTRLFVVFFFVSNAFLDGIEPNSTFVFRKDNGIVWIPETKFVSFFDGDSFFYLQE